VKTSRSCWPIPITSRTMISVFGEKETPETNYQAGGADLSGCGYLVSPVRHVVSKFRAWPLEPSQPLFMRSLHTLAVLRLVV
jgi:hypothetical protein